jgi:hypothetical protein
MFREVSLAIMFLSIIFGILLYQKYEKEYRSESFVDAPTINMGSVPVPQSTNVISNTMPGTTVTDPNKPTIVDLENTLSRITFEKRILENSRSQSENVKTRIANLDKVKQDISEYIEKIKRNKLSINDIPFTKADLGAFLLKKDNTIPTKAIPTKEIPTKATPYITRESNSDDLMDKIGETVRDLKWGISVEYDPKISILKNIQKQIANIERELSDDKLSPTRRHEKSHKLKILEQQIAMANNRNITSSTTKLKPYNGDSIEYSKNLPSSIYDNVKDDTVIHDYTKRASSASFNNESVNGTDYKQKALFLCKQIQNAELGDPVDFGCINNPETDVSPEYSWRGNYKMICNRLGRIWGGWYPEMFGCPVSVGTDEQAPVIFETKK